MAEIRFEIWEKMINKNKNICLTKVNKCAILNLIKQTYV